MGTFHRQQGEHTRMWKTLIHSIREYKKPSILAPIYVSAEVVIECIIPFITALLVNQIKAL